MDNDLTVNTAIRSDDVEDVLLRALQLGAEDKDSFAKEGVLLHLVLVLDVQLQLGLVSDVQQLPLGVPHRIQCVPVDTRTS